MQGGSLKIGRGGKKSDHKNREREAKKQKKKKKKKHASNAFFQNLNWRDKVIRKGGGGRRSLWRSHLEGSILV